MALARQEDDHGLPSLRDEVESLFSQVLRSGRGGSSPWLPSLDLIEEPEAYIVEIDMPGVRQQDVSISVAGRRLTVSGRREMVRESADPRVRVRERWSGSFSRSLDLPDEVDESRIAATMREGILRVTLPRRRGGRR